MSNNLTQREARELAEARATRRAELKAVYQRMYNNPFRTNATIFDPIAFRYEAARAYMREFYRFTPRSLAIPAGLILFTVFIQKQINKDTRARENAIKSGEMTYYDRAMWRAKNLYQLIYSIRNYFIIIIIIIYFSIFILNSLLYGKNIYSSITFIIE